MPQDEESPIQEKWDGDHLDRVASARFLTTYLNSIYCENNPDLSAGHFVLNLNASWGQGKTFLLTKWAEDLKQARYPVVTFDAWKNDFSKDPLVGFMSELYAALDPWLTDIQPAKAAMRKVRKSASKLISAGVGIFAGGAAAGLTEAGLNALTGVLDVNESSTDAIVSKVADSAGKLADRALKEHREIKKAISDFRDHLETLITAIEGNKKGKKLPLYIFVDELDRCRPTYAIELLENIKHLFGVKGDRKYIYFDFLIFLLMLKKRAEPLLDGLGAKYVVDAASFHNELFKVFNPHPIIRVPIVGRFGDVVGKSDESLLSLMQVYLTEVGKTAISIREKANKTDQGIRTRLALFDEASSASSTTALLSLSEYADLVRQAGQLS